MQNIRRSNSLSKCRLCENVGYHEINVWSENNLSGRILECLGILVRRSDDTSKICQQCFDKVNKYLNFREKCAARKINNLLSEWQTNIQATSSSIVAGSAIHESNLIIEVSSDGESSREECEFQRENSVSDRLEPVMCITVIDPELDDKEVNVNPQNPKNLKTSKLRKRVHKSTIRRQVNRVQSKNGDTVCKRKGNKYNVEKTPVNCIHCCKSNPFENRAAMEHHVRIYHARGVKKTFECHLCKKKLSSFRRLKPHMNALHDRQQHFICPLQTCMRIFYSKYSLNIHTTEAHVKHEVTSANRIQSENGDAVRKKYNSDKFSIRCFYHCKEYFDSMDAMLYHAKTWHARGIKKSFECHLCKKLCSDKKHTKDHMNRIHSHQKKFVCPFSMCLKVFYGKIDLKLHVKTFHAEKAECRDSHNFPIKCSRWNCRLNTFDSWAEMRYHEEIFHANGIKNTYECHICHLSTLNKTHIQRHINTVHSGVKPYQCQIPGCSKEFTQKVTLNWHIENVHSKSTFCCDVCKKPSKSIGALQLHVKRMHNNQPRFKCGMPLCNKTFARMEVLKDHVRNDHRDLIGIKHLFCCYLCKAPLSSKDSLRRHMNDIHTRGKHLKCPIQECAARFTCTAYLEQHLSYKHGQGDGPLHQCDVCKKIFAKKLTLQRHMSLHGAEKQFKCPKAMCFAAYHCKSSLDEHMISKHGEKTIVACPVSDFRCANSVNDQSIMCITVTDTESEEEEANVNSSFKTIFKCPFPTCSRIFYRKSFLKGHLRVVQREQELCLVDRTQSEIRNITDGERIKDKFPERRVTGVNKNTFELQRNALQNRQKRFACPFSICSWNRNKCFFDSDEALEYHTHSFHSKKVTFECYLCNRPMQNRTLFFRHFKAMHIGLERVQCPYKECSGKLIRKKYLKVHMKTHNRIFSAQQFGSHNGNMLPKNGHRTNSHKDTNKNFFVKCASYLCKEYFKSVGEMVYHAQFYHVRGIRRTFQCYLCKREHSQKLNLRNHMNRIHWRQTKFKCPFFLKCHIRSAHRGKDVHSIQKTQLEDGSERKDNKFPIECSNRCCKNSFESTSAMLFHVESYHARATRKIFECHLCKKRLHSVQTIKAHMNTRHSHQNSFTCPFSMCSVTFYRKNYLASHLKRVHKKTTPNTKNISANQPSNGNFTIKCAWKTCNNLFESAEAMVYHGSRYHARGIKHTFECHLCKTPLGQHHNVLRHINTAHVGLKSFHCPMPDCLMKFARADSLKAHISTHKQSRFKCQMSSCSKEFSRKRFLREHFLNEHQNLLGVERTFCCYLCQSKYSNQVKLRTHMNRNHIVGNRFNCPISKCSMKFCAKYELKNHLANKHAQGHVHQCDLCKKILTSKGSLQTHMAVHGAGKRFHCPKEMCSVAFYYKNQLNRHMQKMHGEKGMLSCPLCNHLIENRQLLKKHIDLIHLNGKRC